MKQEPLILLQIQAQEQALRYGKTKMMFCGYLEAVIHLKRTTTFGNTMEIGLGWEDQNFSMVWATTHMVSMSLLHMLGLLRDMDLQSIETLWKTLISMEAPVPLEAL